jgi:CheY-like chemotaxis protein
MSETAAQHVLLVEDNLNDVHLIERAIADCSPRICVWSVQDGNAALAFLRHKPPFESAPSPALILLDLKLPGRDGYDVLTELRGMPAHQTTPVVIVTESRRKEDDEQRCLQLGVNAYVQKPVDFDTYFGRIQDIIHDWLGTDY